MVKTVTIPSWKTITKLSILALWAAWALGAQNAPAPRLLDLARRDPGSAEFREALVRTFSDADLGAGKAVVSYGPDFLWAIETATRPDLFVDNVAGPAMAPIPGTQLWFALGNMKTGSSHSFFYTVAGKKFGGRTDVPAYGPDSYAQPGVPQGKLSEKFVHTSKIYEGIESEYWIYVPAQYDPKVAAALMVWQDGASFIKRDWDAIRLLDVIDNLIYQKKIPVTIGVFISPGDISNAPDGKTYEFVKAFSTSTGRTMKDSMRSVEYIPSPTATPASCEMKSSRRCNRNITFGATPTAARLRAFPRGESARLMSPGNSPRGSAACSPGSAASPASSGARA